MQMLRSLSRTLFRDCIAVEMPPEGGRVSRPSCPPGHNSPRERGRPRLGQAFKVEGAGVERVVLGDSVGRCSWIPRTP